MTKALGALVICFAICGVLFLGLFPLLTSMNMSIFQMLVLHPLIMLFALGGLAMLEQYILTHKKAFLRAMSKQSNKPENAKVESFFTKLAGYHRGCCKT